MAVDDKKQLNLTTDGMRKVDGLKPDQQFVDELEVYMGLDLGVKMDPGMQAMARYYYAIQEGITYVHVMDMHRANRLYRKMYLYFMGPRGTAWTRKTKRKTHRY